jgi:hypothetical protein
MRRLACDEGPPMMLWRKIAALGVFFGEIPFDRPFRAGRALPAARWESLVRKPFHGSYRGWWIEK